MNSFRCPQCGLLNWATVEACKRCGAWFALELQPNSQAASAEGTAQHAQSTSPLWPSTSSYGAQDSSQQGASQSYAGADSGATGYSGGMKKREGLAMTSLVLGIVGFVTFGGLIIGSLVGLVLGMVALNKASKRPSMYGGRGIAIAGIVVNSIALCFMVVFGVIMAIALPNLLAARRAANEAYAIRNLRTIADAEEEFQHGPGGGSFGTINELVGSGLLQPSMTREMRNGYRFQVRVRQAMPGVEMSSFEVVATPQRYDDVPNGTGKRSFFVNEFGVIRAADKHGREADVNDPPLGQNSYRGEYAQPTQVEY